MRSILVNVSEQLLKSVTTTSYVPWERLLIMFGPGLLIIVSPNHPKLYGTLPPCAH